MLFNAEKSEHLSIRQISSSPSSSDSHVIMGGVQYRKLRNNKHLGITIQSSLKWSRHICNVYTACARRVGILRRLKRKLQPSTILKIYTGTVRPLMEYACAIWSGGPTAKLKKLQRSFCRSHGVSLPPLQTRFDYFTLMLFYKSECVYHHKVYKTCCRTHRHTQAINFVNCLIQYQKLKRVQH